MVRSKESAPQNEMSHKREHYSELDNCIVSIAFRFLYIGRDTVAEDLIISHRVAPLAATIGGVALDGVNYAVFHLFNDTHMIGIAILCIFIIPVEEDNHTGARFKAVADPLTPAFEPLHTVDTAGKIRNNAGTQIAAFIGTPTDKAGTPFHSFHKSVPTPITKNL